MAEILLTTLNARYAHSAFGLRYLLANMGELASRTELLEFVASAPTTAALDAIIERNPRIVGIGVYIWNVNAATRLIADLKRALPQAVVVIGGPEVSYEVDQQEIVRLADYVVTGEADLAFAALCRELLNGRRPDRKVIEAPLPALDRVAPPYHLYDDEDVAHRVIYVEVSRGCPYSCEFCLSSLEIPVRQFPLDRFLAAMQSLLDRGAHRFKFVDRTFNLNLRTSRAILEFFLERYRPGLFLHFEMIPDRFPDSLRGVIQQFPAGVLQFEVGVQTFNDEVAGLISRRQDNAKLEENPALPARRNRRARARRSDRRTAGRISGEFRGRLRPARRDGASGDPGGNAQAAARHADRATRCGLADGLQPRGPLRSPFDPIDRRRGDGRPATVRPLLGSGRQ